MVDYIEQHKDEFGVAAICATLEFAASTYYEAKSRLPSGRTMRDGVLLPLLLALWVANYRVYWARKMWKALRRAGEDVGRDQAARLMRELGIQGVNRSKTVRTTRPDEGATRHPDLVERQFVAQAPNQLYHGRRRWRAAPASTSKRTSSSSRVTCVGHAWRRPSARGSRSRPRGRN